MKKIIEKESLEKRVKCLENEIGELKIRLAQSGVCPLPHYPCPLPCYLSNPNNYPYPPYPLYPIYPKITC